MAREVARGVDLELALRGSQRQLAQADAAAARAAEVNTLPVASCYLLLDKTFTSTDAQRRRPHLELRPDTSGSTTLGVHSSIGCWPCS